MTHKKLAFLCLFLISFLSLQAEDVYDPNFNWGLNIPESWTLEYADPAGNAYVFADSRKMATLTLILYKSQSDNDAEALMNSTLKSSKAEDPESGGSPEISSFSYNGRKAYLADAVWPSKSLNLRGYFLSLDGEAADFMLIVSAVSDEWESYHDFLVSALDSFYDSKDNQLLPGPLTQFVANDNWAGGVIQNREAAVDASQVLIEREARVLEAYTKSPEALQKKAWLRFYSLVWRDSFSRLEELALAFKTVFDKQKLGADEVPVKLLHWVQSFTYEELDTLSDLRSPYDSAYKRLGDCDARALVFMILLKHLGYTSILMISPVHQHALVGLDLEGEGARFPFEGKNWLVCETTEIVPLGMIAADMADPKDWIGMDLQAAP